MPAPSKTTDSRVIRAARKLLEKQGQDGFSMKEIAAAVGVRAPSLYGRFSDRAALLAAIELQLLDELARVLAAAAIPGKSIGTLVAQAEAYRQFAKANPQGYALLFDVRSARTEEGATARARALAPSMAALVALVGPKRALLAARVLAPYLHGFASMEIAGAFRLGGGLDAAFSNGVATILRGLLNAAPSLELPDAGRSPPGRRRRSRSQ
jgi:AcrR family transcriptional regulator